ncbi:hypothetical protein JYT61_00715, partial [bacterium AH-315-E10]|nr:hypothetical protein [bacterium AH-315-E10]
MLNRTALSLICIFLVLTITSCNPKTTESTTNPPVVRDVPEPKKKVVQEKPSTPAAIPQVTTPPTPKKEVKSVPATAWGITPDKRAVESGIFIRPVSLATKSVITFTVTEPSGISRTNHPVRGSIPFYRGEIGKSTNIRLFNASGRQVPVQGMATAYWPEGTYKFLCLDFLTGLNANETQTFTLEYGTGIPSAQKSALKVSKNNGSIQVDTGKMSLSFAAGNRFSSAVKVDGKAVTRDIIKGFLTVAEGTPTTKPTYYPLTLESVSVKEKGPVQTTIYLKGRYSDLKSVSPRKWQAKYSRYIFHGFVRLYANSARMDVTYSLGFNGNEHKEFIKRYGLTIPLAATNGTFTFGTDKTQSASTAITRDILLAQPHHSNWSLTGGEKALKGKRFGGWAAVSKGENSVLIGLRNAWQQWPVSFRATAAGDLSLDIHGGTNSNFLDLRYFPKESGPEWTRPKPKDKYYKVAPLHLSKSMYNGEMLSTHYQAEPQFKATGILKISELVIDFSAAAPAEKVGQTHHQMLVPWPGKKRYAATRVFGFTGYFPDLKKHPAFKKNFDFHARTIVDLPLVQHEANKLYGWVDYPDGLDVQLPKKGETRFNTDKFQGGEGWNNGEKVNQAVVSLYVASGWRRALDHGHQMLLHTIGIDMEHPGGDMSTTVTHRHCQVHWGTGGSPRQSGCYIGWNWYYWISGHNEIGRILDD